MIDLYLKYTALYIRYVYWFSWLMRFYFHGAELSRPQTRQLLIYKGSNVTFTSEIHHAKHEDVYYFKVELRTVAIYNVIYYIYHIPSITIYLVWLFIRHVSVSTMSSSGLSVFMLQTKF
jgi:hypothetical protein